jgi:hypothetical protein
MKYTGHLAIYYVEDEFNPVEEAQALLGSILGRDAYYMAILMSCGIQWSK